MSNTPSWDQIYVSDNEATGFSLNWSRRTCRPTKECWRSCYGVRRTVEEAKRTGAVSANTGPITWPTQVARYERNSELLEGMSSKEIAGEGRRIAVRIRRVCVRRGWNSNLRQNGVGDLTLKTLELIMAIARNGVRPWGFSRKPEMILELAQMCDKEPLSSGIGVAGCGSFRPVFRGSVDHSTRGVDVIKLGMTTRELNGEPSLAYMAMPWETAAEIKGKPFWSWIGVVLGYHGTGVKTRVRVARECGKTAGRGIGCQLCKRCMNV